MYPQQQHEQQYHNQLQAIDNELTMLNSYNPNDPNVINRRNQLLYSRESIVKALNSMHQARLHYQQQAFQSQQQAYQQPIQQQVYSNHSISNQQSTFGNPINANHNNSYQHPNTITSNSSMVSRYEGNTTTIPTVTSVSTNVNKKAHKKYDNGHEYPFITDEGITVKEVVDEQGLTMRILQGETDRSIDIPKTDTTKDIEDISSYNDLIDLTIDNKLVDVNIFNNIVSYLLPTQTDNYLKVYANIVDTLLSTEDHDLNTILTNLDNISNISNISNILESNLTKYFNDTLLFTYNNKVTLESILTDIRELVTDSSYKLTNQASNILKSVVSSILDNFLLNYSKDKDTEYAKLLVKIPTLVIKSRPITNKLLKDIELTNNVNKYLVKPNSSYVLYNVLSDSLNNDKINTSLGLDIVVLNKEVNKFIKIGRCYKYYTRDAISIVFDL